MRKMNEKYSTSQIVKEKVKKSTENKKGVNFH